MPCENIKDNVGTTAPVVRHLVGTTALGRPHTNKEETTMKTNKNHKKLNMFNLMAGYGMAMVLSLSMALPTFAAHDDEALPNTAAAITKILKTPIGTLVPDDITYEFIVTATGEDGGSPSENMPKFTQPFVIPFDGDQTLISTVGDVDTYYRESPDIFKNVTWPHAGVFEYHVMEVENSNLTAHPSALDPKEEMTYSKAEYTLKVYVVWDGTKLKITHIGALNIQDDDGDAIDPSKQEKLVVEPEGGENYAYSQMIFVNTYVKTNGKDEPEDPDNWTLEISKTVTGETGDTTYYFDFPITVTSPTLAPDKAEYRSYKAYVVEGTTVVTAPENHASVAGDKSITFQTGIPNIVKLKSGQSLVFVQTPVGTNYIVSETGVAGYAVKATVTYAGGTPGAWEEAKKAGDGLTLHDADNDVYKNKLYVGEGKNSADFTNHRGIIPPTGLGIDDFPFVLVIGLAGLSLLGFVIIKSRRGKYTQ